MTIPPFPSQDLAKLVLGYLAEEQLMTAYDEFLQASPYLDALRNEYDRIFMTSLKNILAEYRAVKIYVETCKPITLRRRLFGCTNLLQVVTFLVQHIDVNKLHAQESASHRVSSDNVDTTLLSNTALCEACNLKLPSCVCKNKPSCTVLQSKDHVKASTSNSSVETTLLEDLPGSTVRKKHVKVLEKDSTVFFTSSSCEQIIELGSNQQSECTSVASLEQNIQNNNHNPQNNQNLASHSAINISVNTVDRTQKIEELNDILNIVSAIADRRCNDNFDQENVDVNNKIESTADNFQDFSTGVNDNCEIGKDNGHTIVPDSSTSENFHTELSNTKDPHTTNIEEIKSNNGNEEEVSKPHFLFKLGAVKNNSNSKMNSAMHHLPNICNISTFRPYGILRPKSNEQRVTILSDVKVDKRFNNKDIKRPRTPAVPKNATSTPLTSVQTILINGTPAYRHEPKNLNKCNYTKDEIMAMPTIILVPTGSERPPSIQSRGVSSQTVKTASTTISPTVSPLGPITVDISTNSSMNNKTDIENSNFPSLNSHKEESSRSNAMLIKTVDVKNASVPKDIAEISNKDTPHALPPTRKSSSTPRRSSHVRVLDFTTPRRILQETINEHVSNENSSPVETIISKSPNLHTFVHTVTGENISTSDISVCTKENNDTNKVIPPNKCNWDADLRALAVANEKDNKSESTGKPKPKHKPSKKKKLSLSQHNLEEKKSYSRRKATKTKIKASKAKRKSDEVNEEPIIVVDDSMPATVKPTINIIPGPDWCISSKEEDDKNKNNSNNEEQADTPEMDRTSLHNVIGAKLNISDLLETPYKQALYDIQMETPRFLGPDLPDDPMSDIKIMSIPTPRFLNTSKPPQATPTSYSTRPTDYSSGGSYYKPDDQDYLPIEDLEYPTTSTKDKKVSISTTSTISENDCKDTVTVRSSRPIRKCTKNVSYYNSPCTNTKTKESNEKSELASPCSEGTSANSLCDNKVVDENTRPLTGNKSKHAKIDIKKSNTSKKRKTPVKKDTKTFMKIKPRRPTPTKGAGRTKRKASEPKGTKRTNSKEKHINVTPVVTSAPTKSRRKSSTPRKLPCTKTFISESSGHDSPELIAKNKQNVARESSISRALESDTEQLALRWSDDGSQEARSGEPQTNPSVHESDDITKIQEYIATSYKSVPSEHESNLHIDLVKRGFDIETAKIIERDLLDTPPYPLDITIRKSYEENKENETVPETTLQSDGTSANLQIEEEDGDCDEIELSVHECNEDTENYITCSHDDMRDAPKILLPKLKDKFSMEVCIDDDVTIRLRATPFSVLLDQNPQDIIETEMAVSSISNIDKLYTPMKESIKAQCFEIFDSTLTSLDTPLKALSPKKRECEVTVTEIVLDVERVEVKEKTEAKKRKRLQSGNTSDDSTTENKRSKPEPQYLLNSANIQNIDIETVLCKLHGP